MLLLLLRLFYLFIPNSTLLGIFTFKSILSPLRALCNDVVPEVAAVAWVDNFSTTYLFLAYFFSSFWASILKSLTVIFFSGLESATLASTFFSGLILLTFESTFFSSFLFTYFILEATGYGFLNFSSNSFLIWSYYIFYVATSNS